jgi:hypothetical protein
MKSSYFLVLLLTVFAALIKAEHDTCDPNGEPEMDPFVYVRTSDQRFAFEYMQAFLDGLHAEHYVRGTNLCNFNLLRAEMNLAWMNHYLGEHRGPVLTEDFEGISFNVSLSVIPIWPFTAYFCYKQPQKIKDFLYSHYPSF